jgi:lambda repressor-like predicted transcriptional regulator
MQHIARHKSEKHNRPAMHPKYIVAALHMAGVPPKKLAQDLGLHLGTVSNVIGGHGKSRRVARRIAEITRTPISKLWPGKYPEDELRPKKRAA